MNNSSIKPISGVSTLSKAVALEASETVAPTPAPAVRQEKVQAEARTETHSASSLANVSIHFRMDEKTNEVTIFLVDRSTKKVLRSIPSSELQKLQISDLLNLTA
ncbi:MAG TPA: flagellar protein FlaG [Anaerolineales bacterium]|nr:flagellar protein FlaG [Anaerolineales bacterium]HNN13108.1 flagellar protein FlaG [Anaerolineales bacterium]HNO31563.1 flagellar protein FlaG [Anaerolineales bacterium]